LLWRLKEELRATLGTLRGVTVADAGRQFHFIRPIASGGFGTVYLCKEVHLDGFSRVVAVKLLNAQWTDVDEVASRIRDEARLLGLLRHRNIVDVYALTSIDGRSAVIMEYLEAVDLRYLIKHCSSVGVRLPVRPALEIVAAVAGALDAAYNRPPMKGDKPLRVIHRDIKPSNIMLDGQGSPKVLDFGVAQSDIASREANTQELQFGSVEYMAPERLFFEPETPSSDVYSLAATLYELLAFERLGKAQGRASKHDAHLANRLSFLRGCIHAPPEVVAGLEALLLRALHFEHENRPDAATFCHDAKQLARRISGDDLATWSEKHVPDAVEAAAERSVQVEPLSDAILREDSAAYELDPPTAEALHAPAVQRAAPTRESVRAAALRKGALAELESSADIPITAGPNPHDPPAVAGMGEWTDAVGWNDRTIGDLTDGSHDFETASPVDVPEPRSHEDHDTIRDLQLPPFSTEDTVEQEHSVTQVPTYDTMAGLEPVRVRPPLLMIALGALLPLVGAVIIGAVGVSQDWGGIRTMLLGPSNAPIAETNTGPSEAAQTLAEAPSNAIIEADSGIRFSSEWPDTVKLRVRCKEVSGKGSVRVGFDRAAASGCSVTAYRADRDRVTTTIDVVTAGKWACFGDEQVRCIKQ
jgi:serine/threonine protein kinase